MKYRIIALERTLPPFYYLKKELKGKFAIHKNTISYRGYKYEEDTSQLLTKFKKSDKGKECNITIYENEYDNSNKVIYIDGKATLIGVRNPIDVENIIYSFKEPMIYCIKVHIDAPFEKISIRSTTMVNSVKSLERIEDIPKNVFVTYKVDGITAIIAYIKHYGLLCYDTKWRQLEVRDIKIDYPDSVFLGELYENKYYLFLEANKKPFTEDYKHMKKFIELLKQDDIRMNYIIMGKETYQEKVKKLLEITSKEKDIPKSDGIIFGDVDTKKHLKWKSLHDKSIDFYVKNYKDATYLYASIKSTHIKKLYRQLVNKYPREIIIIGEGPYVKLVWTKEVNTFDEKYNNKIVECKYEENKWIPFRIRDDKTLPNNYTIANRMWWTIQNPIPFDKLIL